MGNQPEIVAAESLWETMLNWNFSQLIPKHVMHTGAL